MSITEAVASEFSSAAMLDMAAAKIAAMIRPTSPIGSLRRDERREDVVDVRRRRVAGELLVAALAELTRERRRLPSDRGLPARRPPETPFSPGRSPPRSPAPEPSRPRGAPRRPA